MMSTGVKVNKVHVYITYNRLLYFFTTAKFPTCIYIANEYNTTFDSMVQSIGNNYL